MKLLVPVDFTEITNPLLRVAKTIATAHQGEVYLLHSVPPAVYIPYPESFGMNVVDLELMAQLQKKRQEEAKEKLTALAQYLKPLRVELLVEVGDPAEATLEKEKLANLILMGSHRKSLIERILIGSTTEKVLKYTKKPLFILKGKEPENFKKVVVCYDFSEHAQKALDFALELLSPFKSHIILLHIEETIEIPMVENLKDLLSEHYRQEKLRLLDRLVEVIKEKGFEAQKVVFESASPSEGIKEYLKKTQDVELVVMGSRGLSGLQRVLLGSTSSNLARSLDLPMLVHRSIE
ncbi:MAG: universal stress protein [Aquificota bacterium]|nr:MAG: universal stress protein [Aquificota bacterium]